MSTCYIIHFPNGASGHFVISSIGHLFHGTEIYIDLLGSCHRLWENNQAGNSFPISWAHKDVYEIRNHNWNNLNNVLIGCHRFGAENLYKINLNEKFDDVILVDVFVEKDEWPKVHALGRAKFPALMRAKKPMLKSYKKIDNLYKRLIAQKQITTTTKWEYEKTKDIVSFDNFCDNFKNNAYYNVILDKEKVYKNLHISKEYTIPYKYIFNDPENLYKVFKEITGKDVDNYIKDKHQLYIKRNKKFVSKFLKYIDFDTGFVKQDYNEI